MLGFELLESCISSKSGRIFVKLLDRLSNSFFRLLGDSALNTFLFHLTTFATSPVSIKAGIILYKAGLLI
jgi:hypothetical protein